ncbi:MAG: fibronectin type III domain-containing protein [Planctomycetes bacterium]|nr:fibronectin type III domain-containing protein [Planctomycetota bacterium]
MLATAALAGCSGGGGTPRVGGIALEATTGGDVPVEFVLFGSDGEPVDVELAYSVDGGASWQTGTVRSSGSTRGLSASSRGVRHVLQWDALADLGARAARGVKLAVRTFDRWGRRNTAEVIASAEVENLPPAADRVESYMIHFGPMDSAKIAIAETHDLVILYTCHPSITRAVIAEIQNGVDPADPRDDVIVLGYVNVGEDDRTIGISDNDLLLDPRFVGDGSGPRLDPRGAGAAGQPLAGLDPLGLPSVSGGYASFYLDENSLESNGIGDGLPDRNGVTGACYVNMGDPAWFEVLDAMRCETADQRNGFRELLTTEYGLGLGCDGVFLDNVDSCAPNAWTGPGDPDQAEFEWTAPGYRTLVGTLRTEYPKALVMQNRGLFFFHPDLPHYAFNPRADLDFVKLESYRLDRETGQEFDAFTFGDNKFNWGPKLQAEAYRDDGFQVLSLGYAEGPGIDHGTLTGSSAAGFATLVDDILEAQDVAGYRHYLMDAGGQIVNDFVRLHSSFADTTAPVWTSTYNINAGSYPTPPTAPDARIGIQQVVADVGSVTVRWDVALDLNPVRYALYYGTKNVPGGNPEKWFEQDATRVQLDPEPGLGYEAGVGANVYAYEAKVTGLLRGKEYHFAIRAFDAAGNEDDNTVVLSATTKTQRLDLAIDGEFDEWDKLPRLLKDKQVKGDSAGPDWKSVKVTNDGENLFVWFETHDEFNLDGSPQHGESKLRIYLDVDDDPFSGYPFGNIGAELVVHGDGLHRCAADVAEGERLATIAIAPRRKIEECELALPLALLDAAHGSVATRLRLVFVDDDTGDRAPDRGYLEYALER